MAHRNGDNLPKQQGNLAIKRKASSLPKTILNLGILGAVLCVLLWWGHHWDYLPQQSWKSWDASDSSAWSVWRSRWILPVLQPALNILVWMFVLLTIGDRLRMVLGCIYVSFQDRKRVNGQSPATTSAANDATPLSSSNFQPLVLVQLPMYNERTCYRQCIAAACQLEWYKGKLVIQVLDDSDEEDLRLLIQSEVDTWRAKGAPVVYLHRPDLVGNKAGALSYGLHDPSAKGSEFVAIFDADFTPASDFLQKTLPHFERRPNVWLVQARWGFVNPDQNLLTRFQEMARAYHFEVEHRVPAYFVGSCQFNGTGGVIRIRATEESGGWSSRTPTEDADISLRLNLEGRWKAVYLNDVLVPSEIPLDWDTYSKQQKRWFAGHGRMMSLYGKSVLASSSMPLRTKRKLLTCILIRRATLIFANFGLFCLLLPLATLVPEARVPLWAVYGVPLLNGLLFWFALPRSWPLILPFLVFENVIIRVKAQSYVLGLLNLKVASEWIVTAKLGFDSESKSGQNIVHATTGLSKSRTPGRVTSARFFERVRMLRGPELCQAAYMLGAAAYSIATRDFRFTLLNGLQGAGYLLVGLGAW